MKIQRYPILPSTQRVSIPHLNSYARYSRITSTDPATLASFILSRMRRYIHSVRQPLHAVESWPSASGIGVEKLERVPEQDPERV